MSDEVPVFGGVLSHVVGASFAAEREDECRQVVSEAAVGDAVLEQGMADEHVEHQFRTGSAELSAGQQRVEGAGVVEDGVQPGFVDARFLPVPRGFGAAAQQPDQEARIGAVERMLRMFGSIMRPPCCAPDCTAYAEEPRVACLTGTGTPKLTADGPPSVP
jgi:hypothetical protein